MTLETARWIIIGLCVAILAVFLAWSAGKAWKALCEGWRESLRLGEDRAIAQLDRRTRLQGKHRTGNTDPFAAVAAPERPSGNVRPFMTPAEYARRQEDAGLDIFGETR